MSGVTPEPVRVRYQPVVLTIPVLHLVHPLPSLPSLPPPPAPAPCCSRFLQGRDTDRNTVAELKAAIKGGRECTVRLLNYTRQGKPFWNMLTVAPIK